MVNSKMFHIACLHFREKVYAKFIDLTVILFMRNVERRMDKQINKGKKKGQ